MDICVVLGYGPSLFQKEIASSNLSVHGLSLLPIVPRDELRPWAAVKVLCQILTGQ